MSVQVSCFDDGARRQSDGALGRDGCGQFGCEGVRVLLGAGKVSRGVTLSAGNNYAQYS